MRSSARSKCAPSLSIRAQLALLALLIAGPLIALLAYQAYREYQADAARAAQGVQRVARSAAADTRRMLDETELVLKRLASHAAVRALSTAQCDPAIEDFRAAIPGYANILTISAQGEIVCSAVPPKDAARFVGGLEWVQRAVAAKGVHVSKPTSSVVTGERVVYVTYPLEGGLIAAALQISDFQPVSEEHGFAEDTLITIVDADGYMVARSTDARAWVGRNVRGQGVVDIALERRSGYVIAPGLMGIERVFGFAEVPGVPWVVYAGVRSAAVFAEARASAIRAAGLALLVILITAVLVTTLAQRIAAPIRGIARTAAQVADGRMDVRAQVRGSSEIAEVAAEFNRMLERQQRLTRRVFQASEDERQRLSRELHDRVGQPLAALRINLDVLRARAPQAQAEVDRLAAITQELIRLVRSLTAELRPPELEQIGLAAALRNYADAAAARYGFAVDVLGAEFEPRLPRAAERALFRIAQEALANAAKHAKAETVTIELDEAGAEAIVSIADDGRGFDAAAKNGGFGLHTMGERAEEAGGRLEVESEPGYGTRVIAAVPRVR